ncbi:MAG: cation transporter, partial [Burkholderiales bacterium]|nr:cation transporter [Phycisphaerae bacterium]
FEPLASVRRKLTIGRPMRYHVTNIPKIEFRAAMVAIIAGLSLLVIKFAAYWITESSAVFSDALESIVNVLSSMIALWALAVAHKPADAEHPYGHGKAEFMSAGLEGGMILLASIVILARTAEVLYTGALSTDRIDEGLLLIGLAMVVNGFVGAMLLRTGRRQHSATLEADGHHLLSDAVTSIAVLIGLGIVRVTGYRIADPICAVLIAIYIGWIATRLIKRSFAGLMDEQDQEDKKRLTDVLDTHTGANGVAPRICSYHKLRHRHNGRYHWVDFHIMVPTHLSISEGHRIASEIEYEIECLLGEGNATAHVEPCPAESCEVCGSMSASPVTA